MRALDAIIWLARRWNLPVQDIATLFAVESSFNPRKIGGENNAHAGLIQWGQWEQTHEIPMLIRKHKLPLNPKTHITNIPFHLQVQLAAFWVEHRRNGKPIRSIHDAYRTINPGAYSKNGDAFGTKAAIVFAPYSHKRKEADQWLKKQGYPQTAIAANPPKPISQKPQTAITPPAVQKNKIAPLQPVRELPVGIFAKHPTRGLVLQGHLDPKSGKISHTVIGISPEQLEKQISENPEQFLLKLPPDLVTHTELLEMLS